jgi:hypothetical protein
LGVRQFVCALLSSLITNVLRQRRLHCFHVTFPITCSIF